MVNKLCASVCRWVGALGVCGAVGLGCGSAGGPGSPGDGAGGGSNGAGDGAGLGCSTDAIFTAAEAKAGGQPKTLQVSWGFSGSVDHFGIEVAADGTTFTPVDRNGDGQVNDADRIAKDSSTIDLAVPLHLTNLATTRYRVVARGGDNSICAQSADIALLEGIANSMIGYVKASNTGAEDWFGQSVALSADGSTLAVGAISEDSGAAGINGDQGDNSATDSGAVYVFVRNGAGQWSQQANLKASNTGAGDGFGVRVALSWDGSTLAVGAYLEDSAATGVGGDQSGNSASDAGAVYVFGRDGAGQWSQQAYVKASNTGAVDWFGISVALSGDGSTLAVGAAGEDSGATGIGGDQGDNSANNTGAVYVFGRDGSGQWSQQDYLKASNTGADDFFGYGVALSGDGNTLTVGAPTEDSDATGIGGDQDNNSATDSGAVYVFGRNGSGPWSQQAYLKASNTGAGDYFGNSVALSAEGNTLAVGAYAEDSGASGINGHQGDNSAEKAGAAYVFGRDGAGQWSQQAYLKASNTNAGDWFGWRVALSADGGTLVVGAVFEDSAAAGINGDQGDNSASDAGAVYAFGRNGAGQWSQQAYVKASSTGTGDYFGGSVALTTDGTALAVGAPREASAATGVNGNQGDNSATFAGAVYLY